MSATLAMFAPTAHVPEKVTTILANFATVILDETILEQEDTCLMNLCVHWHFADSNTIYSLCRIERLNICAL